MCELLLIRHGQTDWNVARRYQGSVDIPLNEEGRQQARELSRTLASMELAAIYASHLSRAKETAEIIRADRPLHVGIHNELQELHFGHLEGKTFDEVSTLCAQEIAFASKLPSTERIGYRLVPGQESGHEMLARILPVLQSIAKTHPNKRVLIVTHGGVIRTLLIHLAQLTWEETHIPNGQGALIHCKDDQLKLVSYPFAIGG